MIMWLNGHIGALGRWTKWGTCSALQCVVAVSGCLGHRRWLVFQSASTPPLRHGRDHRPPTRGLQLRSMHPCGTTRKSGTPTHPRASTIKLTVFCLPWRHQPPGIRGETVHLSKNYLNYTIMQYRGELIRLPTRGLLSVNRRVGVQQD
jgi:hypothetical protein